MASIVSVWAKQRTITTKKLIFYDVHSKTVIRNRLRMSRGGSFVIKKNTFFFYNTHSKAVPRTALECTRSIINKNGFIYKNVVVFLCLIT